MEACDTKQENVKTCSRCCFVGDEKLFILRRNICRKCISEAIKTKKAKYKDFIQTASPEMVKLCNTCSVEKHISDFIHNRTKCGDCRNADRRNKYWTNEQHNKKAKEQSIKYKKRKAIIREEQREIEKQQLIERIGEGNAICKYCGVVKSQTRFRYNRLKCRECERDDPLSRLYRNIRVRIKSAIANKTQRLLEYLGCNGYEYFEWLKYSNPQYLFNDENWHIDHVIPLSAFNMMDETVHNIAFNWRNTMPLLATENLSKNSKILPEQIRSHVKMLEKFHKEKELEFPNEFKVLFAKHLDAGSPLEPCVV
jgi:hypothetical protein